MLAWLSSPVLGLLYLGYSHVLPAEVMGALFGSPLILFFIIATSLAAGLYFHRMIRPLENYIHAPVEADEDMVSARLKIFPYEFWIGFLLCALAFPALSILVLYQNKILTVMPLEWLRYYWTLLSVSLLVGLLSFFRLTDLFGRFAMRLPQSGVQVSTSAKLIGIGSFFATWLS